MGDQRSSSNEAEEVKKVLNMINSLKKSLFLANHGKRSAEEPADDEVVSDEDLEVYFNSAPTGFFFMPKPFGRNVWKKSDYEPRARPNGFMFPTAGKRSGEIFVRPNGFLFPRALKSADFQTRNPNGFNFPVGKRGEPSYLDMDMEEGNFLGQRGKRANLDKRETEDGTFFAVRG